MLENKYKIIFIDIDGTLVDDEKRISEETINIIKNLKENGIFTVLTSGKPYESIRTFSEKCYAIPYLIASNGAIVRNLEKNIDIFNKNIEKDTAIKILSMIKESNLYTMVTISGNLVVDEEKYGVVPKNRPEVIIGESLQKCFKETDKPIIKFSIIDGDKNKISKIREKIIEQFDVSVTQIDVFGVPKSFRKKGEDYPNPYCVDVMPKGVTKAEAIKEIVKYLGINLSETIAFGDGMNDIEMFQTVNYKVAMENAVQELKNMADIITKSNNESGVAVALKKIFFE